jgi:hypothetical protein
MIFWGYVLVWLIYGWRLSVHLLDAEVRRSLATHPNLYSGADGASRAAEGFRGLYLFAGFALALVWPVVAPARGLYRMAGKGGLFTTPTEAEYARAFEVEQLREQARRLGLPMPGDDR